MVMPRGALGYKPPLPRLDRHFFFTSQMIFPGQATETSA